MALPWLLLVVELGLYASCFVCGIITAASVTITQGNLSGRCMLYGTVTFNGTTGSLSASASSAASLCYFVSAVSVCVAVFCFSLSLYWLYTCCVDGVLNREHIWMNLILVACGFFLLFLLVTGCILKIGRDKLCDSVVAEMPKLNRCEDAQNVSWDSGYNGKHFYSSLHNAETAVWVNFFFWLIIGVLVGIQRRQRGSEFSAGGDGSPSETEPIFHRPQ